VIGISVFTAFLLLYFATKKLRVQKK